MQHKKLRLHNQMKRRLLTFFFMTLLTASGWSQQDIFVDAENGDDVSGDGSMSMPYQSVKFALSQVSQPQADIILFGTTNENYDCSEIFPWPVTGNISFLGAGGILGGPNVIVDSGNLQNILEYDPFTDVTNSVIQGITFRNAPKGIVASPFGSTFQPTITECTFENISQAIEIVSSAGSTVNPTITSCESLGNSGSFLNYQVQSSIANGLIEGNSIAAGFDNGVFISGNSSSGTLIIRNNQFSNPKQSVYILNYLGAVQVTSNSMNTTNGNNRAILIQNSDLRGALSRIENNTCLNGDWGIHSINSDDLILSNNNCSGAAVAGIEIDQSDNCLIQNNLLEDCVAGIRIENNATGNIFRSNTITNSTSTGIQLFAPANQLLRNTIQHATASIGIHCNASSDSSDICGNTIVGSQTAGIQVSGQNLIVAENSISFVTPGPGILDSIGEGNLYSSNLIHNCLDAGIDLTITSSSNVPIFTNNTLADNAGPGLRSALGGAVSSIYVINNIFWGNNSTGDEVIGVNLGSLVVCDLEDPGIHFNQPGNFSLDPLFVGGFDYHLQPGSPCIDRGDNAGKLWATDVDGQPRILNSDFFQTAIIDVGADEVAASDLQLSGSFQQGGTLLVDITGPANGTYAIYAATDPNEDPFAPPPGTESPFGTVLLDQNKLISPNPIASGGLGATGTVQVSIGIPNGFDGTHVVVQGIVTNPSNVGQTTRAEAFVVEP